MVKDFDSFNEAAKDEPKKWFGVGEDPNASKPVDNKCPECGRVRGENARDCDTCADYLDDMDDMDDGGDDYDDGGYDDVDLENDDGGYDDDYGDYPYGGYPGGAYGGYRDQFDYRNAKYAKGDAVIYVGNTGKRKNQNATVHRIREDGKIVLRFEDRKLIAVSLPYIRPEDWKKQMEEQKKKREEERKKREAEEERLRKEAPPLKPGQKWWEVNKKDEKED